jgi:hypothetical protein
MPNLDPILSVLLDDPRVDGYIVQHGLGSDYPLHDPQDTGAMSYRGLFNDPLVRYGSHWDFNNCVFVPEIGGAIIQPQPNWRDAVLGDWTLTGSYWRVVRPWGWKVDALEWYATDSQPASDSVGTFFFSTDSSLVLTVCLAATQTDVRIRLDWDANDAASLQRRFEMDAETGVIQYRDVHNGVTLRRWNNQEWLADLARNGIGGRTLQLRFLKLDDYLLIYRDTGGQPLVYHEAGLTLPPNPLRVGIRGGAFAFNVSRLEYSLSSTNNYVQRSASVTVDPTLYNVPDQCSYYRWAGGGTDVTWSDQNADPDSVLLRLTLTTSNAELTPILYQVQLYSAATLTVPEDLAAQQDLSEHVDSLDVTLNELRGHTATLRFRDFDSAVTCQRLGKVTIAGNWDQGTGEVADEPIGTLYVTEQDLQRDGALYDGRRVWTVRLASLDYWLGRETVRAQPSFGAHGLGAACTRLLLCGGVPPAWISVVGTPPTLDGVRDERRFLFSRTDTIASALDTLVASKGWEWLVRFSPSHQVVIREPLEYAYPYDLTIDSAAATFDDLILDVRHVRTVEGMHNYLEVLSRATTGQVTLQTTSRSDSVMDPEDAFFAGRWLSNSLADAHASDATNRLATELRTGLQRSDLVELHWHYHPTVHPNQFVRLTGFADVDVPDNTVYKIVQKTVAFPHSDRRNRATETLLLARADAP